MKKSITSKIQQIKTPKKFRNLATFQNCILSKEENLAIKGGNDILIVDIIGG